MLQCISLLALCVTFTSAQFTPIVITTFSGDFAQAAAKAETILRSNNPPQTARLDALTEGIAVCEELRCDGTVGYGGSPDELGESTVDALIMDGLSMKAAAVANLRRVKNAIGVARAIFDHTRHTMLVGDSASNFAVEMGFRNESLSTDDSIARHLNWVNNSCQPNFRQNTIPPSSESCGPYKPGPIPINNNAVEERPEISLQNHDTIAMVVLDRQGRMAAGTSTNGANWKIPGRVGDAPIIGSGAFVDSAVGGCGATGDGDIMMRFLPCYAAVDLMRQGFSPSVASEISMRRILRHFPRFQGMIIAMNRDSEHGAASANWNLTYTVATNEALTTVRVTALPPMDQGPPVDEPLPPVCDGSSSKFGWRALLGGVIGSMMIGAIAGYMAHACIHRRSILPSVTSRVIGQPIVAGRPQTSPRTRLLSTPGGRATRTPSISTTI